MGVGESKVAGMVALRDISQNGTRKNVEYRVSSRRVKKSEGEGDGGRGRSGTDGRTDGTGRSGTERREYQGPGNEQNTRATK